MLRKLFDYNGSTWSMDEFGLLYQDGKKVNCKSWRIDIAGRFFIDEEQVLANEEQVLANA